MLFPLPHTTCTNKAYSSSHLFEACNKPRTPSNTDKIQTKQETRGHHSNMRIFPFKPSSPLPTFSSTQTQPSSPLRDAASESVMVEKVENARTLISKWFSISNPNTSLHANHTYLFREDRSEAKRYLNSVMDLQEAMQYYAKDKSATDKLLHAHELMEIAMYRLQNEFHQILSSHQRQSFHSDSDSGRLSKTSARSSLSDFSECESDNEVKFSDEVSVPKIERGSTDEVEDLKAIADCMLASGYGKECLSIYKSVRKSIVDEGLFHLGLLDCSHASSKKHKIDWEVLEVKIKSWLNSMKTAIKTLFNGEKILLDRVFSASESIRESCFSHITRDGAISLFEFAESVAKCKKSPEKLFRIFDLYEAIADAWPEIESIFCYESTSHVRSQAAKALVKLGEAARAMLTNFESAIQKDSSKKPVSGGGVHPLTRYVMNYLNFLTDYGEILADVFVDWPLNIQSPLPESYFTKTDQSDDDDDGISSAISTRFAWLILVLLCKLNAKAKLYKNVALSYLFLANNLQYVVVKVRGSNLRYLLGDDWTLKHEETVKQYIASYVRIGWSKVFSSLPEDPTAQIDLRDVKVHFKEFNSSFDESYRKQVGWVVPDAKLRDEVRLTLVRKVLKSYAPFYEKYRGRFKKAAMEEIPIVRYAPEDLDYYLSDLFATGSPGGSSGTVSSLYASTTSSLNATPSPSPPRRSPARTIGGRAVEVN